MPGHTKAIYAVCREREERNLFFSDAKPNQGVDERVGRREWWIQVGRLERCVRNTDKRKKGALSEKLESFLSQMKD